MKEILILKVKSNSEPNKIAGAIVAYFKENKRVELQAIGAGAVNQAVKAIAIARSFVASSGVNLVFIPAFTEVKVENKTETGIKFIVREEF